jgi:hypothetical protein
MRSKGGVRLKLYEEPRTVVIPLAQRAATLRANTVQKKRRPAIEASELAFVAVTLILMSFLFAVAHRIVQHPWSVANSPPGASAMSPQSIVLNPTEGDSASRTAR